MSAYLFARIDVTDTEVFADYGRQVGAVISQYGGQFVVRGGAMEFLEGDPDVKRLVVLEFSDMAAAKTFYNSPEYAPLLEMRLASANSKLFLVEGYASPP